MKLRTLFLLLACLCMRSELFASCSAIAANTTIREVQSIPNFPTKPRIYLAYLNSARSNDPAVPTISEFKKWLALEEGHLVVQWRRDFEIADFAAQAEGYDIVWFVGHGLGGETMGGENDMTRINSDFFKMPAVRSAIEGKFVVFDLCFGGQCWTSQAAQSFNQKSLLYSALAFSKARGAFGILGESIRLADEKLLRLFMSDVESGSNDLRYLEDTLNSYNGRAVGAKAFTILIRDEN